MRAANVRQEENATLMTMRRRKLIGAVTLVVFLIVYALLAAAAAIVLQVNAAPWVELAYYAVAGLLWTIPAGLLISWMSRPDR